MADLLYGIGIRDLGAVNKSDPRTKIAKDLWRHMFGRCYAPWQRSLRPTYDGCSVGHQFHRFEQFALWAFEQRGFGKPGWHLDKDIIVRDNKVYSPDACAFVPREINVMLTRSNAIRGALPLGVWYKKEKNKYVAGCTVKKKLESLGYFETPELAFAAYKRRKEEVLKAAAEEYKSEIDARVYAALMAYEVHITD